MYLLYEKEFEEVVRREQKKLLRWIQEAVKLNPNADINTIIAAAVNHVDTTAYKVKNVKDKEEVVVETPALPAAPAEPVTPNIEASVQETFEIEQDYQPMAPPTDMYAGEAPVVEDYAPPVEDYAPPVELQQEPMEEVNYAPVQDIDSLVDAHFSGEESVPLNEVVNFAQKKAQQNQEIAASVEESPQAPAMPTLPARTDTEVSAELAQRKRIEANINAIYRDPSEIQDL